MAELNTGIRHIRDEVSKQSAIGAEMSVLGIIGPAPDADPAAFPLDTNVYLTTADSALRAFLGASGTLEPALEAISAQLGTESGAARVIVRRVDPGANEFATIANIVGSESAGTGVWGFLTAAEEHGFTPRLLLAPGFTHQTKDGVKTVAVSNGGTGYTTAPTVGFTGGVGTGAAATANLSNGVAMTIANGGTGYTTAPTIAISAPGPGGVQATATVTVNAGIINAITVTNPGYGYTAPPTVTITGAGTGGVITAALTGRVRTVTMTNPGGDYTSAPTVAFTGGGGTGAAATATIGQAANAVCAIMPTICDRLKANFIPEGPKATGSVGRTAWLNWLETLPQGDALFHPLAQRAKVLNSVGNTEERSLAPYIAGLYIQQDNTTDGVPARGAANLSVRGIVGVEPTIPLSLTDPASAGQDYLTRRGGIVARGESGVESAAGEGGFSFWGFDTLSPTSDYAFTNVKRMRDYIELTQLKMLRVFLGRNNVTVQTVTAIVNSMTDHLTALRIDGFIIDGRVRFEPDRNQPAELRLGRLDITFEAEEPPAVRRLTIRSRRYERALTRLVQQLAISLNGNSAA
jgi:hypothetical protein